VPTIIFLLCALFFLPGYADISTPLQQTSIEKTKIEVEAQIHFTEEEKWIQEHQTINFTGDPNWLPFEVFTKEGEYIGIIADLLEITEERSGIKFDKLSTENWEESVVLLKSRKVDILTETTDSILRSEFLFT